MVTSSDQDASSLARPTIRPPNPEVTWTITALWTENGPHHRLVVEVAELIN